MSGAWTVSLGLPLGLRPQAARLYWDAFGPKLGIVLGPNTRALAFLQSVICADHALIVTDRTGALLGLAGFKTPQGSFAMGNPAALRQFYGPWGAFWRIRLLGWLSSEVDNDNFLIDGICVASTAQGQGIGTALIDGLCAQALTRGYRAVRLDVIDTNSGAQRLYRRMGFVQTAVHDIGLLRFAFGFARSVTMVRRL
ncbi:MAG: GNAT family N-acetyltransferase [Pseudomonadota bacterium]